MKGLRPTICFGLNFGFNGVIYVLSQNRLFNLISCDENKFSNMTDCQCLLFESLEWFAHQGRLGTDTNYKTDRLPNPTKLCRNIVLVQHVFPLPKYTEKVSVCSRH